MGIKPLSKPVLTHFINACICVIRLNWLFVDLFGDYCYKYWLTRLVRCSLSSCYLNQCELDPMNTLRWIFNQNWQILILSNAFKNFKLSAIVVRGLSHQCVKIENSLPPSNEIWWLRYWPKMLQMMACCLMAPSHYLSQCWLGIIGIYPTAILQKMHNICCW